MARDLVVGELTLVRDTGPADWVVERVGDFENGVGSVVPEGFEAYARVFHPASRLVDDHEESVTWRQIAEANGRKPHPGMEWTGITGSWKFFHDESQPGLWDVEPHVGSPPVGQAARLASLLTPHTLTPDRCWFAVWEGYGALLVSRKARVPKVKLPHHDMFLLCGGLTAVTTSLEPSPLGQLANLWWPEDRAWCVASEIDLMTTYVGGTAACITELLSDDLLEVMPVSIDQRVSWDSDDVNPPPTS
ncbi:MAG: hypothetical protein M3O55_02630 [Actinomycetota bacterium]|nr:hypothetical protein [Actinomycetota bacterium]